MYWRSCIQKVADREQRSPLGLSFSTVDSSWQTPEVGTYHFISPEGECDVWHAPPMWRCCVVSHTHSLLSLPFPSWLEWGLTRTKGKGMVSKGDNLLSSKKISVPADTPLTLARQLENLLPWQVTLPLPHKICLLAFQTHVHLTYLGIP